MEILHYTHKLEEKEIIYLNNRYGNIHYQYDYNYTLFQLLRFNRFSNKKVFKAINKILLGLTIFIGLIWLKVGYKADSIVRLSMILFIRIFGLFLKIGIFVLNRPFFKAEIRENGIIIYSQCVAYDIREISNIEMEKYYDGSVSSVKFVITDKDGIKRYYYWPYDDTIEKFCNDSILYYKKKNINIKIPIDNREPTAYETKNNILDYWKILSDKEKENANNYIQRGLFIGFGIALFVAFMISSKGDGSKSSGGGSFLAFLFFLIIFNLIHIITFLKEFKSPTIEIKENKIIIGKVNLRHDYINCSSITDAKYKYFKKDGVDGIKLTIIYDGKESVYTWIRSKEIEKFCNDVVEIAKNNKEYYSRINSSD